MSLQVLILEDVSTDAELIERTLRKSGLDFTARVVATRAGLAAALEEFKPDILLSDFKLPDIDGLAAIKLAHRKYPDLPIIIVTGILGDETAVELIKGGAVDYILKDRLARLPSAVQKALHDVERIAELVEQKAIARAEKDRFDIVADAVNDAIVMMNAEGIITFWNRAAQRVFGYSEIEVIGRDLHVLLAPKSEREWARRGLLEFAKTGEGPVIGKTREYDALRKNGDLFRVELSISALELNGKWIAMGLARDVSRRPGVIRVG